MKVHKLATPNMFENVHLAPAGSKTVYTHVAVVKGAPDRLLPHVHYELADDKGKVRLVDGFSQLLSPLLAPQWRCQR